MPSPRRYHWGWKYGDKMWIFGGYGESPVGYLNDHGNFNECGSNNQLFSYDPSKQIWKNVECFGEVPSPRLQHSAAVMEDKVWLSGGYTSFSLWENEFYELNMNSLAWTHIHTSVPTFQDFSTVTLAPLTANQLVIHGHSNEGRSTWILDVNEPYQCRKYRAAEECYRSPDSSTGISGLNNDVIILGEHCCQHTDNRSNKVILSVMLEPKTLSLQHLALRIIHQYKTSLTWKSLPPSLQRKLTGALSK